MSALVSGNLPCLSFEKRRTGSEVTPIGVSTLPVTSNEEERPLAPLTRIEEPK